MHVCVHADPAAQMPALDAGITYEGKVQLLAFCVFEVRARSAGLQRLSAWVLLVHLWVSLLRCLV